ncbi:unnamed protein product [Peniophora sp. CBMAI 1063]|nr:unnamed protein product [Peniophora sp. CBMAI 1063]
MFAISWVTYAAQTVTHGIRRVPNDILLNPSALPPSPDGILVIRQTQDAQREAIHASDPPFGYQMRINTRKDILSTAPNTFAANKLVYAGNVPSPLLPRHH